MRKLIILILVVSTNSINAISQKDSLDNYFEITGDSVISNASNFKKGQEYFLGDSVFVSSMNDFLDENDEMSEIFQVSYEEAILKFGIEEVYSVIKSAYNGYRIQLEMMLFLKETNVDPTKMNIKLMKRAQDSLFYFKHIPVQD